MKNNFYLLFFALTVLCSCKSEDQSPDNLKKQMVDKWNFRNVYQYNYGADNKLIDSVRLSGTISDIMEFKDNDTYTQTKVNGNVVRSGTFAVTSNTAFTVKEDGVSYSATVRSLNYNSFVYVLGVPRVAGQSYSRIKYWLTR